VEVGWWCSPFWLEKWAARWAAHALVLDLCFYDESEGLAVGSPDDSTGAGFDGHSENDHLSRLGFTDGSCNHGDPSFRSKYCPNKELIPVAIGL
jgi:hypothetical protein